MSIATRMLLIAHAPTPETREIRFASASIDCDPRRLEPVSRPVVAVACGPERRVRQTALMLGLPAARSEQRWSDLDVGAWAGRRFDDVLEADPAGLGAWVSDPGASPHDGESVVALLARVTAAITEPRDDGLHAVITSPMVLRAAVAVVTGDARGFFAVDAGPLDAVEISVDGGRPVLKRLRPYPQWVRSGSVES